MSDVVGANRANKFGVGIAVIVVVCIVMVWCTNPELILSWFRMSPLPGELQYRDSKVIVINKSDQPWTEVKVILNKNSVSQRYEALVPKIVKHPQGYQIKTSDFKKSNGEAYDSNMGDPQVITVEAKLPDGKSGALELKLSGKKL